MRYAAFETLIAPARPSSGLGRLVSGIALILLVFVALSIVWSNALPMILGAERWSRLAPEIATASTPTGVLVNLFTFALLIVALSVALRSVHGRGMASLIGPLPRAARQFGRALLALVALYTVVALVPMPETMAPELNLGPGTWAALLPLALLALGCQVFAEEAIFRGYLQSQLAAQFASPLVWILLPAVTFGVLHFDPVSYGANGWLVAVWATIFGVAAADLTARFGTLGPATALHLLNNFSALLIAAPEGQFDGLALYSYPFSISDSGALAALLPLDLLMLLCSWLAIRVALRG